ncbi:MAG: class I SAM-dependent methyltransferase [Saccharospirillum sp.]|uniref:class I SAM-dependent DNA methyltransferase n=1 Tax=Saccharospirillum sp. TaxID=2033801 RepID=UPI003299B857
MNTTAKFWDKLAPRYATMPIADEAAYQEKLEITRQYLQPNSDVLELGCGTGSTAVLHAPTVKHYLAVDCSSAMLDLARTKAKDSGVGNLAFEQATVDEFTSPGVRFDVVLALSLLHLLEDKEAVLSRIHGFLKPGGVFISSTACLGDRLAYIKYIAPIGRFFGKMPLVKVFTVAELEYSMIEAGFAIEYQWQPDPKKAVFMVARKR